MSVQHRNKSTVGTYPRGIKTTKLIVNAAKEILVREGYSSLSIRKVANAAGISVGNLTYYFHNKSLLLEAVFELVFDQYKVEFSRCRLGAGQDAVEQLRALIEFIFVDLGRHTTTVLFPEIWALANHQKHAASILERLYQRECEEFIELIGEINPNLSPEQIQQLALFIIASIEGHTMFVGYKKKYNGQLSNLTRIASFSFIELINNIKPQIIF